MRLPQPMEVFYLVLMSRWHMTAPPDGHQGEFEGEIARNTQIMRIAYLLNKIALPKFDRTYSVLSLHSRREDGESYISRNASWMKEPTELGGGWYFEGCTSLEQKQQILRGLTKVGLSGEFVRVADDFVEGRAVDQYFPTEEEAIEILKAFKERDDAS